MTTTVVRLASTVHIPVPGAPPYQLDGKNLVPGDRALLRIQSSSSENGVYVYDASTLTLIRDPDFDTAAELLGLRVFVSEGDTLDNTRWQCTSDAPTPGSGVIRFEQIPNHTDKFRIDQLHGNLLRSPVTLTLSALSTTIDVLGGKIRQIPAQSLSGDRNLTLSAFGAFPSDTITLLRSDMSQYRIRILDAAGQLLFDLGGPGVVVARFDGLAWQIVGSTRENGVLTLNVRDFGARGDGVTRDDEAIQAALNVFSPVQETDVTAGVIFFPRGVYPIEQTLVYRGAAGCAIHLRGEIGYTLGMVGTVLRWTGSAGGKIIHLMGANGSVLEDLEFDGMGIAKYCVHLDYAAEVKNGAGEVIYGGVGSSGWRISRCSIAHAGGADSVCLALGPESGPQTQTSEVLVESCFLQGASDSSTLACIKTLSPGNTKNITIRDTSISGYCHYGVDWDQASGMLLVSGVNTAGTTIADYRIGGGEATIIEQATENVNIGAKFITSDGAVTGAVKVIGGTWVGTATSNSVAIKYSGTLTLIGVNLKLHQPLPAPGDPPPPPLKLRPIIQLGDPLINGNGPSGLFSTGSLYWNCDDYIDVIDGSTNPIVANDHGNNRQIRVVSINDYTYDTTTSKARKLKDYHGNYHTLGPGILYGHTYAPDPTYKGPGFSREVLHEPRSGWTKQVYTYEAFLASTPPLGADQRRLIVGKAAPRAKLVAAYLHVTTPFTGTSGGQPLQTEMRFGNSIAADAYIAAFNASSAPVTRGLDDAELGTQLKRSAAVQGGHVPNWSGYSILYLHMVETQGFSLANLTAGSVEVIMKWEVIP
ncbi:glycosyl hydrolase family 28-related protein [Polyangium mundeleinium]|uniref:Glycosyl hydrolase family 28-related protein n=1 Tax=Polyangium mundeleinium TaxID=2995306 RepID=A0ABT5EPU6_9BACT|nr:glycosyl hydrolase family 28-related protein [Polyangium mundeleinium]MDC0743851.1 glycosyl hydrolase family 28-related protein [Polyangium mundeleinium]